MSRQVKIVEFAETRVAALEHRGDWRRLNVSLRKFIEWRRQNGLPPRISDTYNIFHEGDDIDLCASTDRDVESNSFGVVAKTIPGGRCAMLRHIGSEGTLGLSIAYLCSEWLPESGESLRDFPLFCHRVEFFPDVPAHEAVTDLYLPLER
jgi:AraC family transcriptional regulator